MTNQEFKKEYKEFKELINKYQMLADAYNRLPSLIRFTIFLEKKLGILSNESLFRIISTMHFEYTNIAASLSVIKDERQREYAFQTKNIEIWNSISAQIYNSLNMVSVLGERNDAEYIRMAKDGVANLDYFNVYYSLVKYQMSSKIGDKWPELPTPMKLFLTTVNNFDDDFKMAEYIDPYIEDIEETIKGDPTLREESHKSDLESIKSFYAAVACSRYIHKLEVE